MKKLVLVAGIALTMFSTYSSAALVSMGVSGNAAFTTTSVAFLDGPLRPLNSGYANVANATSTNYVAYNPNAVSPSTFTWASTGTFDLNSFWIAGAWGSQTLTISGYNGASLVGSSNFFVTNQASLFNANWTDLTHFSIFTGNDHIDLVAGGSGKHWALNDITINEAISSVPVPASALLFAPALLGFMGLRSKTKK